MGGGTFGVSVIGFRSTHFEVLASVGNSAFSRNEIACRIADDLFSIFEDRTGKDARSDSLTRSKRILSTKEETNIEIDNLFENESLSVVLSRSCLEMLISDFLERIVDTVKRVIALCEAKTDHIDEILFCGGSARIPKLQRLVCDLFSCEYSRLRKGLC
jgi:molecular chaperone DnaK (HSP70)